MIRSGNRVSIEYTVKLDDGSVVESNVGEDPVVYEHGKGQILQALENRIEKLDVEETKQVTLSPEEAYGPVKSELFQSVKPDVVPEEARRSGAVLTARDETTGDKRYFRVHEVQPDKIVLDFNHQLAGQRLHFDVKVLGIEKAGRERMN
jgi:FKBP-type peptidyl-prolyl cis-trans isomerase 2